MSNSKLSIVRVVLMSVDSHSFLLSLTIQREISTRSGANIEVRTFDDDHHHDHDGHDHNEIP